MILLLLLLLLLIVRVVVLETERFKLERKGFIGEARGCSYNTSATNDTLIRCMMSEWRFIIYSTRPVVFGVRR